MTIDECTHAVTNMKLNKSPGTDGLTSEFYIHFWDVIKHMVINALNESIRKEITVRHPLIKYQ